VMKRLFRFIKWRLTDGSYKLVENFRCACCGKAYKEGFMIPTYLYWEGYIPWGVCYECRILEESESE
jgi:hypothetical protein